jgi:dolichyl-phosphate-mannose--protein O-mannosyl transferase
MSEIFHTKAYEDKYKQMLANAEQREAAKKKMKMAARGTAACTGFLFLLVIFSIAHEISVSTVFVALVTYMNYLYFTRELKLIAVYEALAENQT